MDGGFDTAGTLSGRWVTQLRYLMLLACAALVLASAIRGRWLGVGVGAWLAGVTALDLWEGSRRRAGRSELGLAQTLWVLTAVATLYVLFGP